MHSFSQSLLSKENKLRNIPFETPNSTTQTKTSAQMNKEKDKRTKEKD
jgi:hypothetical protein